MGLFGIFGSSGRKTPYKPRVRPNPVQRPPPPPHYVPDPHYRPIPHPRPRPPPPAIVPAAAGAAAAASHEGLSKGTKITIGAIFGTMAGLCLLMIVLALLKDCWDKRPANSRKQKNLSRDDVSVMFPSKELEVDPESCVESSGDPQMCCICLETLHKGTKVRALDCGHTFHSTCIVSWLTKYHQRCPLCNHEILNPPPVCPPPAAVLR